MVLGPQKNVMVLGPQKQCPQVSDIQIQKYKYTNTVKVKFADRPYMCYIFEKVYGTRTSMALWNHSTTARVPGVPRVPRVPRVLRVPREP